MRVEAGELYKLFRAIDRVIESTNTDDIHHGGLLSRNTIRAVDELRLSTDNFKTTVSRLVQALEHEEVKL